MHSRRIHRLLATVLVGLFSVPAVAQFTKDKSANLKIDEAVNTHYFNGEMDKAETLLKGIVDACSDKCSPQTKAKAWMYVGIVRGGQENQAGAKEAFTQAKALDPAVQLDRDLASPQTQATFDGVAGGSAPSAGPTPSASSGEIPGDMKCTPEARNIQTRMPIPISCTSAASVASAELRFKEVGGEKWKKIAMEQVGDSWQAEIPCDLTGKEGDLLFYVGAKDSVGEYVDQYGSKKEPASIALSENGGEVPSFPGKPPVARCAGGGASTDCPPDFPGCSAQKCGDKAWNDACSATSECGCGLTCQEGTCQNAKSCSSDSECGDGGSCVSGKCSGGSEAAEEAPGDFKRFWVGVNVAYDLTTFGANNICTTARADGYNVHCFKGDNSAYIEGPEVPDNQKLGVNSGFATGQLRLMLAFDYAFTDRFTAGIRVGYAIGGHPQASVIAANGAVTKTGSAFLPIHAEVRGTYYFSSLSKPGLRPYVFLGAGVAQMDGTIRAKAADVTIYKYSGSVIVDPGVGLAYAFTPQAQLGVNVGAAFFLPMFWYAVQPAVNFSYGF